MARPKKATAIVVAEELETELAAKRDIAQKILEVSTSMVVDSPAALAVADKRLLAVHGALKELEERQEQLSRPHLDALSGVRSRLRPIKECLEGAKGALKNAVLAFERATKAAQAAALAAVNEGARDGATLALAHGAEVATSRVVSDASEWIAEVHNPSEVPIEYCDLVPNMSKLHAVARQVGETGQMVIIPGVHFRIQVKGRVRS